MKSKIRVRIRQKKFGLDCGAILEFVSIKIKLAFVSNAKAATFINESLL